MTATLPHDLSGPLKSLGFRLTRPRQIQVLRWWHAWLAGGFLVCWLTGDEDTYALHQFSGYAVLAAMAARGLMAALSRPDSLLRLPRLRLGDVRGWLMQGRGRNPLFAAFAVALLLMVGLTALSGAVADWVTWMEHPHEAMSDIALFIIIGHIAFIFYQYGGRRWLLDRAPATIGAVRDLLKRFSQRTGGGAS